MTSEPERLSLEWRLARADQNAAMHLRMMSDQTAQGASEYHQERCEEFRTLAALLRELADRRAAMAKSPWVLGSCFYCQGLNPESQSLQALSERDPKLHLGHKPDCVYTQYPTPPAEGQGDERGEGS